MRRRWALIVTAALVASALGGAPARAGCGGPNCTDVEFDDGGLVSIQVRSVAPSYQGWRLAMISPGSQAVFDSLVLGRSAELGLFWPRQRFSFRMIDPPSPYRSQYSSPVDLPGGGTLTRREGDRWRILWSSAAERDPARFYTGVDPTGEIVFFDKAQNCTFSYFFCSPGGPVRPDVELVLELRHDRQPPTTPAPVTVTPAASPVDDFTFTWGASTDEPVPPNTGIRSYVWTLDTGLLTQTNAEQTSSRTVRLQGQVRSGGARRFCVWAVDNVGNNGAPGCADFFFGALPTSIDISPVSSNVCGGATAQFRVFLRIRSDVFASLRQTLTTPDLAGQTVRLVVGPTTSVSLDEITRLPTLASGTTALSADGRPTVITASVSFGPGPVRVFALFDGTSNYAASIGATGVVVKAGGGPSAPTGVVVTPSRSSFNAFNASWSAATSDCGNIRHYLYSVDGEDDAFNFAGTSTDFTVRGAATAGRHTLRIRAVDDSGNLGAYSVPVPFELTDSAPPTYVVDVGAVGTAGAGGSTGAGSSTGASGADAAGLDPRGQLSADIPLVPR